MKAIQLVSAQSAMVMHGGAAAQQIMLLILVKNLAFRKHITVHWAGDDHIWHVTEASFLCPAGCDTEKWRAEIRCNAPAHPLPGNLRFALQYVLPDREYWDNNYSRNYLLAQEDVLLGPGIMFAHIDHQPAFSPRETQRTATVAVRGDLQVNRLFLRWTTDGWKTLHQTPFSPQRTAGMPPKRDQLSTLAPNRPSLWNCRIKVRNVFRIDYAIGCETGLGEFWDNNFGSNYSTRRAGVKVLTLNLHCYQESDQEKKFSEIARAINQYDIDIICLQEVGEEWRDGKGNWQSNAARIIQDRLRRYGRSYSLYTDWSHIGFDRYREGSAILSRYKLLKRAAAYVSSSRSIYTIHARKVVMGQVHVPCVGLINVFSVHLSWWENGFAEQFEKLHQWADELASDRLAATLLCGDFNNMTGSEGYMLVTGSGDYEDQFLCAVSPASSSGVSQDSLPARRQRLPEDSRIDFIFARKGSRLQSTAGRILFSGNDSPRVSDHPGYLVEFEPA